MMFEGKKFAGEIERELVESGKLVGRSLLILQCDGSDKESKYVELKRKAGERMGVEVSLQLAVDSNQLREKLKSGEINDFGGVLVQLPIAGASRKETEEILGLIPPEKDVDGLNPASKFVPAVVAAVEGILNEIKVTPGDSIAVVGAKGMVGRRLVSRIKNLEFRNVGEFDLGDDLSKLKDYWVVISATGEAGLIKPVMVREGVMAIDLGYPKGDFDPGVSGKASFMTPVPGGVGPVTVVSLYGNLAIVEQRGG